MKFGVFTVCLPEYTPAEAVKVLKQMGYDGVEWRVQTVPEKFPENVPFEQRYWGANRCTLDVEKLEEQAALAKGWAEEAGIEVFSLSTYLPSGETKKLEEVARVAAANGIPCVRSFPYKYPNPDGRSIRELIAKTKEENKELERIGKQYGVKFLIEIHMDTIVASPSAAYDQAQGIDPAYFGYIYDPGNMVNEGYEDYEKGLTLLGDYVAHVHMKNGLLVPDAPGEFGEARFKRAWVPLKKGMADLPRFAKLLKQVGYDGTVSVEDFSNEEGTVEKLTGDLAYLKQLFA